MIHVQSLIKVFGEIRAVDGISFDVQAGEIFAFLSPFGCAVPPGRPACEPGHVLQQSQADGYCHSQPP
jgi:hypothetical protein